MHTPTHLERMLGRGRQQGRRLLLLLAAAAGGGSPFGAADRSERVQRGDAQLTGRCAAKRQGGHHGHHPQAAGQQEFGAAAVATSVHHRV